MAKKVRRWAQEVSQRFDLPIHLVDERLTSHEANDHLDCSGLTRLQKKRRRDAIAAMEILQTFFNNR